MIRHRFHPEFQRRESRGGFTLIELLVAIAITAILIVFAGQVLTHISSATTQGAAISQVIQGARVVSDQLQDDFDQMLASDDGVLVIFNYKIPDVRFTEEDPDPTTYSAGSPERLSYVRRADQIMFVRNTGNLEPLCPVDSTNYSNTVTTPYVRVWYGHALRTDADGIGPTGAGMQPDFGDLGIPDEFAANWTLGRQALFLDDGTPSANRVDGATWDSPTTDSLNSPTATQFMYYGIADVAKLGYTVEDGVNGAMVGETETGMEKNLRQLFKNDASGIYPTDKYRDRAVDYLFIKQRLRYNPLPRLNYDGDNNWSDSFQAWQIAQMHPAFVANVVDFEISFAGDYDGTAGIDRDPGPTTGQIKWYDVDNPPPTTAAGFHTPASTAPADQGPISDANNNAHKLTPAARPHLFIFRHGGVRPPALIRIRYRIVDPNARVLGADGKPGRIFEQILSGPQ